MEASTFFIKVVDEVGGGDGVVKRLRVFKILVPRLVDGGTDKLYNSLLGRFEGGVVGKLCVWMASAQARTTGVAAASMVLS